MSVQCHLLGIAPLDQLSTCPLYKLSRPCINAFVDAVDCGLSYYRHLRSIQTLWISVTIPLCMHLES
jgi:hypothetical protein